MSGDEQEPSGAGLIDAFSRHAPRSVARILEGADPTEAGRVIDGLEPRAAAAVLSAMSSSAAAPLVGCLQDARAVAICQELEGALAAGLLRRVPQESRTRLLSALPPAQRKVVSSLLAQPLDRVGAHVEPRILAFHLDTEAGVALEAVRSRQDHVGELLFVTDGGQALAGCVPWRALLVADPGIPLSALMDGEPEPIPLGARLDEAMGHPGWAHWRVLPVVDARRRMLGALRYEALLRARGVLQQGAPGPDATRTGRELAGLYSVGLSALWQLAGSGVRKKQS